MNNLNSDIAKWIKSYVFDKLFLDPEFLLTKPFAFLRNNRYKTTKPEMKKDMKFFIFCGGIFSTCIIQMHL